MSRSTAEILESYKEKIIQQLKDRLSDDDKVASGQLQNSITGEVTENEIIISGNKYWYWVNYGREPGKKPPPPDKILEWMKVKGLNTEKTDKANMFKAFRIAAKIGREGIQGTRFVDEVSNDIIASLTKDIGDSYILKINNSFNGNS